MNKKYKIIALIGKAGSGKDTLLKEAIKINSKLHPIISCTTRPPREGEVGGVDYYFYTVEMFHESETNNQMLESTYFKGWHYGTPIESVKENQINIGIFNPAGIHSLLRHPDVELKIFYVTASDKTRMTRQLNRETNPDVEEICRRYEADKSDFSCINFEYAEIENESAPALSANARAIAFSFNPIEAMDESN